MPIAMRYGTPGESSVGVSSSGGGVSVDLLWTNSSPTASFAGQTVSLDLSAYDFAMIQFKNNIASSVEDVDFTSLCPKGVLTIAFGTSFSTASSYLYKRSVTVSDTGVVFGTGKQDLSSGAGYAVPQKIFGIKF